MEFSVLDHTFLREEPSAQCWYEVLFGAQMSDSPDENTAEPILDVSKLERPSKQPKTQQKR